jgi:phage tail tape-measure protein
MKRSLIAIAIAASAVTAQVQAQEFGLGQTIGAITGAVIGHQFGGGTGKVAMTVIGGVIGSEVGRNLSNQRQHYLPQPQYIPPRAGYEQSYDMAAGNTVNIRANRYQSQLDACVGDGVYNGQYNPQAALNYCRGALEASRRRQAQHEADAYAEGLRSQ